MQKLLQLVKIGTTQDLLLLSLSPSQSHRQSYHLLYIELYLSNLSALSWLTTVKLKAVSALELWLFDSTSLMFKVCLNRQELIDMVIFDYWKLIIDDWASLG